MSFSLLLPGLLLLPALASAQHYEAILQDSPYQPIPIAGGAPETIYDETDFRGWGYSVGGNQHLDITLPFPVGFFGEMYTEFRLLNDGTITFDPNVGTNTTEYQRLMPSTSTPSHGMVAVWWDKSVCNQGVGGLVKTQVVGTAPNRKFVLEWNHCRRYADSGNEWTGQLWLSEGSDEIEAHYGPLTGTGWVAYMGIENTGGTDGASGPSASTGAPCDPCGSADFPTDKKIIYSSGPNVTVSDLTGPIEGFAGIAFPISYTVSNGGSKPTGNFTARYWVSPEPELGPRATPIGYANQSWDLNPKDAVEVSAEPRLPIELEAGHFYLIVEADPHHEVDMSGRGSTIGIYGPFSIGIRAANLTVGWAEAPELVKPGELFDVSWLAKNTGNLPTHHVPYRIVLDSSPSISPVSLQLGGGTLDRLEMQEELEVVTQVMMPEDLAPGVYYLGVQMDPEREIFEHERRDNVGLSNPVLVSTEDFVIVNQSLPVAHYQGFYDVRLIALGGQGNPSWAVSDDSTLPPGLSLVTETSGNGATGTFLRGVPAKKGDFSFTLEVRSGQVEAEHAFDLNVSGGAYSLTVVTENLAEAAFGFEYEDHLAGSGGIPPYTWELAGGTELPQGVFLRADGYLSGRPQEGGEFPITFRLTDSQGLQTTKELTLVVAPPNALTCVTKELPILQLGEFVRIPLIAAGGPVSTHSWSTVSTVRLVSNIGESSTTLLDPPPGLRLDQGTVVGEPASVGTYLWTLKVTAGTASTECPVLIHVPSDHGLTVTTRGLPLAIAGRSYRAALDVAGGEGPYTWEFIDEQLAETLNMDFEAGNLVGNPPLDALGGEKEREFSFTVRVEDAKGRIGIGALTLHLAEKGLRTGAPEAEDDEGGCQTGSGDASVWGLALLGLALLRRRAN